LLFIRINIALPFGVPGSTKKGIPIWG